MLLLVVSLGLCAVILKPLGAEIKLDQVNVSQPNPTETVNSVAPSPETSQENVIKLKEKELTKDSSNSNSNSKKNPPQIAESRHAITNIPRPLKLNPITFATFILRPGTLRSEGEQGIKLSADIKTVSFKLQLPPDAAKYEKFSATLKTADGETVTNVANINSLNLNLPAGKLQSRTYILTLDGENAGNPSESVTEYTFRVRR